MVTGVAVITAGVGVLTSRLSAGAWTVVEDSAGAALSAVTCTNSSDCWAVGTAVEHDSSGSSWTNVDAHVPSGGTLNGGACPASDQCWGVGSAPTALASQALIEHDAGGSGAGVDFGVISGDGGVAP